MLQFLLLIISIIYCCSSEIIYSLTNFKKLTIKFNKKKQYAICKYYHIFKSNSSSSTFSVSISQNEEFLISLYLYKDYKVIKQNSIGNFVNYLEMDHLTSKKRVFIPKDHKLQTGYYYLVIKNPTLREINTTVIAYTQGMPSYNFNNYFFNEFGYDSKNIYYNLSTSKCKYIKIGYKRINGHGSNSFYLTDSDKKIILQKKNISDFEKIYNLSNYGKGSNNYYINLESKQSNNSFNTFLFYVIANDYSDIMTVKIDTEDFQEFPLLSEIKLLLDISTISLYDKVVMEYDIEWKYETIDARGYDTSDLEVISRTSGSNILLYKDYSYENVKTVRSYFYKTNEKLKSILLIVKKPLTSKDIYYFHIKYKGGKKIEKEKEEEEGYVRDIPTGCFVSFMLGLALSIPNIAVFWFLVKSKKQKPPFAAISLNILMHIGWGSVLSKSLKIGVQFNYVAGILIIVIILISTIILLIYSCLKDKHYSLFTSFENLYPKVRNLMTLQESINYHKKFPPVINIIGKGKVEESQEIWTKYESYIEQRFEHIDGIPEWNYYNKLKKTHVYISEWGRTKYGGGKMDKSADPDCQEKRVEKRITENFNKTIEYKYDSWQDNTEVDPSLFTSNHNIINVLFSIEVGYAPEAQIEVDEIKNKLADEGDKICDSVNIFELYFCPKVDKNVRCYLNEEKKMKSKAKNIYYFIAWAILFTLGFSSISDIYLKQEEGNVSFTFKKIVAANKDTKYRANYMENDENSKFENPMKLKNTNSLKDNSDDKKEMFISLKEYN